MIKTFSIFGQDYTMEERQYAECVFLWNKANIDLHMAQNANRFSGKREPTIPHRKKMAEATAKMMEYDWLYRQKEQ